MRRGARHAVPAVDTDGNARPPLALRGATRFAAIQLAFRAHCDPLATRDGWATGTGRLRPGLNARDLHTAGACELLQACTPRPSSSPLPSSLVPRRIRDRRSSSGEQAARRAGQTGQTGQAAAQPRGAAPRAAVRRAAEARPAGPPAVADRARGQALRRAAAAEHRAAARSRTTAARSQRQVTRVTSRTCASRPSTATARR